MATVQVIACEKNHFPKYRYIQYRSVECSVVCSVECSVELDDVLVRWESVLQMTSVMRAKNSTAVSPECCG